MMAIKPEKLLASATINELISGVDPDRIRRDLFFLAADPLPCRTLNYKRPGAGVVTLYEADDYITNELEQCGYEVEREHVSVQAFQPDDTVPWGLRKPTQEEPWFDAYNLYAKTSSIQPGNQIVVGVAHKDSQSWLDRAPGAYDNGSGTVALLEIARILQSVTAEIPIWLLFCNEEHWPWTSVYAAERMVSSGLNPVGVFNVDGPGQKSLAALKECVQSNVTRYSTPAGKRIAELMVELNEAYEIGLEQSSFSQDIPNDDDGSFINAGIPAAVMNIGAYPTPYEHYHTVNDTPDHVDIENIAKVARLTIAAMLHLAELSSKK